LRNKPKRTKSLDKLYFKKNINFANLRVHTKEFNISYLTHIFFLLGMKRCLKPTKRVKIEVYENLEKYAIGYTDVFTLASNKTDFEKLKYILFEPNQMALFNLIPNPQFPLKESDLVTQMFIFSNDRDQIHKAAETHFDHYGKKSIIDKKIFSFLNN